MRNIQDIFYGNFLPPINSVSPDSEYEQLLSKLQSLDSEFTSGLTPEQREQYRRITNIHGQMNGLVVADNYIQGFRDGAAILLDVMFGNNENFR